MSNWGWTIPRAYYFGPERIGDVCRLTTDGWLPVLPARHVLQLVPFRTGLVIHRLPPRYVTVGARPALLAVDCRRDLLEPILGWIRSAPRRVGELDLSRSDLAEVTAWHVMGPIRVGALVVPPDSTAEQMERWRVAFAATSVRTTSRLLTETRTTGDRERLLQAVADAVATARLPPPREAPAAENLARTYLDANRPELALAALAPALAQRRSSAFLIAAEALLRNDQLAAALAAFDAAAESGNQLGHVLAKRADALRMAGRPEEAVRLADEALAREPTTFACAVAGFAYLTARQPIAATILRDQLPADDENRHVLTAMIETAKLPPGESKLISPRGRMTARRAEAAWRVVLAEDPGHALALRRLADVQRRRRPWSGTWAGTQLHAVDASPPAVGEGHRLAGLAVKHPRSVSAVIATIVGCLWFELAATGVVRPVSVGWPILAGTIVGAAAFAALRRQIPERARAAARALGHRPVATWATYATLATLGLVIGLPGWLVVKQDRSCHAGRSACPPKIPTPPVFTPPTLTVPTFPLPTVHVPTLPVPTLPVPTLPVPTVRPPPSLGQRWTQ